MNLRNTYGACNCRRLIEAVVLLLTVLSNAYGTEQSASIGSTAQSTTAERLRATITYLSDTIGERNLTQRDRLDQTVAYIEEQFQASGYKPTRQTFQVRGVDCPNLIVEVAGKTKPEEIVLIGAHYDSARGTPGANDNGSGVAGLLEIARQLRGKTFERTIRFVAFANEEPPYFQREGLMSSWVYAKECRLNKDNLTVVISLETMGYFTDEPNSQNYPPLLARLYPNKGNFIGLVSNLPSQKLLRDFARRLRSHCVVDVQTAALPAELKGVGWSDHWSFWQEGYMGIMVTDTARRFDILTTMSPPIRSTRSRSSLMPMS